MKGKLLTPELAILTINSTAIMAEIQTYTSFAMVMFTALITVRRQIVIIRDRRREKQKEKESK